MPIFLLLSKSLFIMYDHFKSLYLVIELFSSSKMKGEYIVMPLQASFLNNVLDFKFRSYEIEGSFDFDPVIRLSVIKCECIYYVHIITSIAHRIKNPLRRTSEHITLYDFKP